MAISLNTGSYSHSLSALVANYRQEVAAQRAMLSSASQSKGEVSLRPEFLMGEDMVHSLGLVALGGNDQLEKWAEKGLDVSSESLRLGFETLNQAMREHFQNPSSTGAVINRYQIVENSQSVPSWFQAEKNDNLARISDPDIKAAFQAGNLYHLNIDAGPNMKALNAYRNCGE